MSSDEHFSKRIVHFLFSTGVKHPGGLYFHPDLLHSDAGISHFHTDLLHSDADNADSHSDLFHYDPGIKSPKCIFVLYL